jgi:2-polyprenyl-3-methyl-5-hydroxy-6-metoxy-1,4-benzoquinol methylase
VNEGYQRAYWEKRFGGDYPKVLGQLVQWNDALVRAVRDELPAGGRHLDVGCGHGALVVRFLRLGFDSYGVDSSVWVIEQARAFVPELSQRLAVADVSRELPFSGYFDVVTCTEVVEHLHEPARTLELAASRLAMNGVLILTTPNPLGVLGSRAAAADPTHVHVREPEWWHNALERVGLRVVRSTTYAAVPVLWRVSRRLAFYVPLGPRLGPGTLIVAKRRVT